MKADHPLRGRYESELAQQKEILELLQNGTLSTGEKTADNPQWTDTTARSIKHAEHVIELYESILKDEGAIV